MKDDLFRYMVYNRSPLIGVPVILATSVTIVMVVMLVLAVVIPWVVAAAPVLRYTPAVIPVACAVWWVRLYREWRREAR